MHARLYARCFLAPLAGVVLLGALPVVTQASPVTNRAAAALTYVEGSTSVFALGGSYTLDLTFDPLVIISGTSSLAGYTLTAISFNYGGGSYTAGASSSSVGSVTAKNNNFFTGDQILFKTGTGGGFGAVEGRVFGDDQEILDLSDKAAGS